MGGGDVEVFLEEIIRQLVPPHQQQRREKIHGLRTCFRHQVAVMQALQLNIVVLVACNEDSNQADQIARLAAEVDSHLLEFLSAVEEFTFVERAGKRGLEDGGFSFRSGVRGVDGLGSGRGD